ncbi:MAG: hypothetical protein K0S79_2244, partial [Nitrospira sp.]|nr:hypothetical protein [Nitrospira sp.]
WSRRPGLNGRPVIGSALNLASPIPTTGPTPLYDPHEGGTSPSDPHSSLVLMIWYGSRLPQPGAGDWNRTSDLRFTKPLLYQLSYAGFSERRGLYPNTGFSLASRGIEAGNLLRSEWSIDRHLKDATYFNLASG